MPTSCGCARSDHTSQTGCCICPVVVRVFPAAFLSARRPVLTTRAMCSSPENPPWKLLKFPDNYTLWIHKKGVITDRLNPRTDAYLYGAPHLGPRTARSQTSGATIFRSPMEFVPHAIWLMRGATGQCDCKYCIPSQNQHDINRRLNHGDNAGESADDEDEDNNGTVHSLGLLLPSNRHTNSFFLSFFFGVDSSFFAPSKRSSGSYASRQTRSNTSDQPQYR